MANRVGQQLGNYHLVRFLGRGSFADVYLGQHLYLKTEAAVKVLRAHLAEGDVEEFLKEAQTIVRLEHPHIIRILDFNVQEGIPFLVMDYAPNGTLRQRHPRGIPVPLPTIIDYTRQIADALQYAHDRKLIHRDVKPENMLLGRHNDILLSDFGIVQTAQSTRLEKTQQIAGTVAYMAPEQLQGRARFASDQYALGIVVYEWLSGNLPFQGSFSEVASQHLFTSLPPLSGKIPTIPPAVEDVVISALAKDPRQRFPSVQAFAKALEEACSPIPFFPSVSTYAPPSPILPIVPPDPTIIRQPTQFQEQPAVAPIPSMSSKAPIFTDWPAHVQQPLTPLPTPSIPPVLPTLIGQSAHAQQPLTPAPLPVHPAYHPTGTDPDRLPLQQHLKKAGRNLLLIALAIFIIAGTLTAYFVLLKKPAPEHPPGNGIGVSKAPDGEYIGISDGTFAFDTNRPDGTLKLQAAEKLKAHNIKSAEALWQSAVQQDTNDAEALIYLEDQRVLASGHPYITFVVGTILTESPDRVDTGRDNLQGAYVAQKEFNASFKLPGGLQVRLLIASPGSAYIVPVAHHIVQAARMDKTIVGVMGWHFSSTSRDAIGVLAAAHIPMISPTASFDFLTGISPYFFRVIPPSKLQVAMGIHYAEKTLHATRAALFVDPTKLNSYEVAVDFEQQFTSDGKAIVAIENYTVGRPQMLNSLLQDALKHNPDLIYFAGYTADVVTLLMDLPTSGSFAHLQVLGPNNLGGNYPYSAKPMLNRLHFTDFVTYEAWDFLGLSAKKPAFFTEYPWFFDPLKQHRGNPVGYTQADADAVFSYDAMLALLSGSQIALAGHTKNEKIFSPNDLQLALRNITPSSAIQGVSGQISFGPDGNPINKAVAILGGDPYGFLKLESVQGVFLVGS